MLKSRFFTLVLLLGLTSAASAQSGAGDSDFITRCAQPGVVRCVGFDSSADISGGYGSNSGIFASSGNANVFPTLDTTIKASSNSSLKFTIPAHSGADTSGAYFANFSPDLSVQFGENSEFYIQWRQRFTPDFVTTKYAGGEGWKQTIIGTGDQPGGVLYFSCTDLEVVTLNDFYRGFAEMYNSCSGSASHGAFDGFEELFGSFDFKLQNARPAPYCLYSQTHTTPSTAFPPTGNCIGYFPNEWMTFQVHIKIGPRVGDEFRNSFVDLWIAREGRPSELAISWGPYNLSAGSLGENQKFGKVWLLPYNTDKDSSVSYPETYVWYDELIISRTKIADPGLSSGGSPIDTMRPSAPTGLRATAAAGQITLAWTASTDNVGVTSYRIFRSSTQVGTSTTPGFVDTGLAAGTTYSYTVAAVDAAGNVSVQSTSASATTPAQVSTTGLVAAYSFNAGSGTTLLDSSGKGNQGTLINSPIWTTGEYGGGLAFDGTNDYVTVPNTAAIDIAGRAITVELWVNAQTGGSTTDYVILNKPWFANSMSTPYYQYGVEFQGAKREFVFFLGTSSGVHGYGMGGGASYGSWYHVAFTYDGANVRGYLNGKLQFTTPETLTIVARGTDLRFGIDGGFGQPFKGRLDDVRIYAQALTQTEIQRDMSTPVGGGTPPPADTQAPAVPVGLTVTAVSSSQVSLSWSAATDNVGVTGYQIYRCQGSACIPSTQVTTVTGTSYQDIGLTSATVYTYRVVAKDAAGNVSAPSLSASATTQVSSPPPTGTSLSTLAASLQPGQWGELTTANITPTLDNLDGASGMLTVYTNDLVWDPTRQQAFLIGADHLASQGPQFVSYTAANNTWQRLPRPAWLSSLVFFHGYDHSAIDQARGILYHRPFAQNVVHRYDIASQTWTQLPTPNFENTYANCCDALEFFPELDGLVWVRGAVGEVWLFKVSTQQWSHLGTWPTQDGGTWTFAEYNPVHKLLMFGSGNENTLFKLSSSGQITQLRNPPISNYDGSGYVGAFTADPVSGTYLLLTPTSRQLYTYDVKTDTWQLRSSPTQPSMSSHGVVATPVSSYGVNLFVSCTRGDCHAYVYKHTGK